MPILARSLEKETPTTEHDTAKDDTREDDTPEDETADETLDTAGNDTAAPKIGKGSIQRHLDAFLQRCENERGH